MNYDPALKPEAEDVWERPLTIVLPRLNVRYTLTPEQEEKVFEAIRQGRAKDPKDYVERMLMQALAE